VRAARVRGYAMDGYSQVQCTQGVLERAAIISAPQRALERDERRVGRAVLHVERLRVVPARPHRRKHTSAATGRQRRLAGPPLRADGPRCVCRRHDGPVPLGGHPPFILPQLMSVRYGCAGEPRASPRARKARQLPPHGSGRRTSTVPLHLVPAVRLRGAMACRRCGDRCAPGR
jgi:hypothetical protein